MRDLRITPAQALLPLRLFLGITFVYAGVQKLSDPGFLHEGAPTYIGTQLHGFANGTPGGFILRAFALPHPELAGVGVAVTEILIGLLATSGFLTRIAAACGMGLNFLLFLTASWHTTPYFLGPDLVFTFAWLPFVLAGAEGQPALDNLVRKPSPALARRIRLNPEAAPDAGDPAMVRSTRRALLAEMGGAAIAIAGIAALAKGPYTAPRSLAASKPAAGGSGSGGSGAGAGGGSGAAQGGGTGGARRPGPRFPPARSSSVRRLTCRPNRPPPTATRPTARRTSSSARPTAASRPSAPSAPTPAARSATKAGSSSAPATAASTAPKTAK